MAFIAEEILVGENAFLPQSFYSQRVTASASFTNGRCPFIYVEILSNTGVTFVSEKFELRFLNAD